MYVICLIGKSSTDHGFHSFVCLLVHSPWQKMVIKKGNLLQLCVCERSCAQVHPLNSRRTPHFFGAWWFSMIFLLMVYLSHLFVLVWSSNPCHSRGPSCVPHALRRLGGGGHGSNRGWGWNAIETPKEITLETLQLWLQYYQYHLGMCFSTSCWRPLWIQIAWVVR